MSQNDFERMGATYHQEGDYLIPDVVPPETPKIGIWGMRRKRFLKTYRDPIYTGMLLNRTLNSHLERIDRQAEALFDLLVEQMAAREGLTEQLKAVDQMAWVGKMNNIQSRAMEIVYNELIFA